jgi:DNA-binding GntR family transcriptional regulator
VSCVPQRRLRWDIQTRLELLGGADRRLVVELIKSGERVACMSLDDWASLAATRRAIEDELAERAPTAHAAADFEPL